MTKFLTIGITDCKKWDNYKKWLEEANVIILKLSPEENNLSDLEKCDGIVLSGGEDVHPKYYGHPEWMDKKEELKLYVNEDRDEFELKVIDLAYRKKIPMLGICRGLQIVNVYFKGTLIPDMEEKNLNQHSKNKGNDQTHTIHIEKNSCLSAIIPPSGGWGAVNSAHHQAANKIGAGLKVSARAEDGTIEAMELKNPKQHPFLLLVQWHPERMNNQANSSNSYRDASKLKEKFLQKVRERSPRHHREINSCLLSAVIHPPFPQR